MIIRPGKSSDANAIVELLEQLGHPLNELEVLLKIQLFSTADYQLLVCEVKEEVVGFISLHCLDKFHSMGKTGRITAFCVAERVRDMGIGGTLLSTAETWFKSNGCREVEVTTNMRRSLTPDFYRKHGFAEHSRHFVKSLITA